MVDFNRYIHIHPAIRDHTFAFRIAKTPPLPFSTNLPERL